MTGLDVSVLSGAAVPPCVLQSGADTVGWGTSGAALVLVVWRPAEAPPHPWRREAGQLATHQDDSVFPFTGRTFFFLYGERTEKAFIIAGCRRSINLWKQGLEQVFDSSSCKNSYSIKEQFGKLFFVLTYIHMWTHTNAHTHTLPLAKQPSPTKTHLMTSSYEVWQYHGTELHWTMYNSKYNPCKRAVQRKELRNNNYLQGLIPDALLINSTLNTTTEPQGPL